MLFSMILAVGVLAAAMPAHALVDTSGMDVIFSDSFDNPANWANPQGNWQIGSSTDGWGTGNVAYIGSMVGKNSPQNLITSLDDPINLTTYKTVLLQFDSNAVSSKRGNQQEKVIVTDERGVQHVVWVKSKATFSGIQQVDISNYVAGNKSINVTFQYVKKGPAKDSIWEVDDFKVFGSTTTIKPYSTIQFNTSAYTVTEGNGVYAVLNLTRTSPFSTGTVTMNWTANDGTALAGINYGIPGDNNAIDVNGTVTFNAGDSYKLIQVPILDDNVYSNPDLSFNVSIEDVTDASGNTISGTPDVAQVTINDADSTLLPVVSITPTSSEINEGSAWSGTGSFTDHGAGTSWTATVDYGDGSGAQPLALNPDKTFALNHIYANTGLYTVTVTVTNNNGLSGSAYTSATVDNVAPTANAGPDQTVNEGDTVSFSGSATDPGVYDTLTYSWNFGDGSPAASGAAPTHVYDDNGIYTVTLTVTDKDGGVGTSTCTITVNNVAPTATFNTNSPVNVGSNIVVSLTNPYDPSSVDTAAGFTYAFDLGSGYGAFSSDNTASIPTTADGMVTVKGKIMDKDGGVTEYTADVTVNKVTQVYTYNLVSGWNLISVPLNVADNSVSGFFPASVLSGIEVIWGWDESAQNWVLYSPDPNEAFYGAPYNYPHLTNMGAGRAYWVYSDNAASFSVEGSVPASAPASPASLVSGWNFVGVTGLSSQDVLTMYPGTGVVWGWDESAQNWVLYSPDLNEAFYGAPYNYPHLTNVLPGHGYWVYM